MNPDQEATSVEANIAGNQEFHQTYCLNCPLLQQAGNMILELSSNSQASIFVRCSGIPENGGYAHISTEAIIDGGRDTESNTPRVNAKMHKRAIVLHSVCANRGVFQNGNPILTITR